MERKNELLTPIELLSLIVGNMIGVGILTLPRDVGKYAHEDGWIAIILGSIYPFYIALMGIYISKKFPNYNILSLSKKLCGKLIGNILNFLFLIGFILSFCSTVVSMTNVVRIYLVYFLPKFKTILAIISVVTYVSTKDLKVIARLSLVIFYITIFLLVIPLNVLRRGNILNIQPVFSSSIGDIMKASMQSSFAYSGIEIFLLTYPYVNDKKKIKKYVLTSVLIITLFYIGANFLTLFYLGDELINKLKWPFIATTETLVIPIVNNFRYIFMYLWSTIIIKTLTNFHFSLTFTINDWIKKVDRRYICLIMAPILIWICMSFGNEVKFKEISKYSIPITTVFNISFVTIIAFLIKINDKNEKKAIKSL
ncbi:spore germination protein (amino acid permease) [Clostridium tetanomorphum]|uniref:GerAB/ArcD/ProY family transporter n=1 Tax=Clostridium tetanomorphum TaxID=1553 RepID=A0A923J3C5_CLOTT|nr:GerAB/ArcD/ProY family transporter [Clostridium tetanomorphum]KAJ50816.1 spore germination protein [Clostridium tetanomorphum DSM 665]MBC2399955.1 GerAB/ArcD/ProY family transporter [Clostridium tetanomorphum]MBP1866467.1 spore germination protein (amino acid permease) [Clostridium tetanomorphum]NRS86646.1 spore germination protein (amino acid permease) [Clostridium tetanomorphum]NRZ95350.1 spore germination protein (amino acid permease) [Clostridium tetanomorphum]